VARGGGEGGGIIGRRFARSTEASLIVLSRFLNIIPSSAPMPAELMFADCGAREGWQGGVMEGCKGVEVEGSVL
jgi:hypothetical protein